MDNKKKLFRSKVIAVISAVFFVISVGIIFVNGTSFKEDKNAYIACVLMLVIFIQHLYYIRKYSKE